jgi:hypothetical protein
MMAAHDAEIGLTGGAVVVTALRFRVAIIVARRLHHAALLLTVALVEEPIELFRRNPDRAAFCAGLESACINQLTNKRRTASEHVRNFRLAIRKPRHVPMRIRQLVFPLTHFDLLLFRAVAHTVKHAVRPALRFPDVHHHGQKDHERADHDGHGKPHDGVLTHHATSCLSRVYGT